MKHTRLVVAVLTFLGFLSAGCASDRQVVRQAEDTHSQLEPTVVEDAQLREYLETMGQRIVDSAKALSAEGYGPKSHFEEDNAWMFTDVRFHFVNSDQLNAF